MQVSKREVAAIIVAAGQGTRMARANQPKKQFRIIAGKSLLQWVVESFDRSSAIDSIIVVTTEDEIPWVKQHLEPIKKVRAVVAGGETRQQSVGRGLQAVDETVRWIVVHDAARPMVTPDLIERVLQEAKHTGAATAAIPVSDTIKRVAKDHRVLETLDRSQVWAVQTPQAFDRELLVRAHATSKPNATDDAVLVEWLGEGVNVVPGSRKNIKVTTEEDLDIVEMWLTKDLETTSEEVVTGFGFDVHRLVEGRPLIIGGVRIDHSHGLAGHSDADVLAHAVTDALLGAASLGDIGTHFPDTDPRYKGADSIELLQAAHELLRQANCAVVHVDAFISAEAPRLKAHIPAMRARIAEAMGLNVDRVSIKAGTGEGAGPVGRAEVIEARAVATVRRQFKS